MVSAKYATHMMISIIFLPPVKNMTTTEKNLQKSLKFNNNQMTLKNLLSSKTLPYPYSSIY